MSRPFCSWQVFLGSGILQVRFESPDSLRCEFEKNIANRGIFVATDESFEVRSAVVVEIVLDYVDANTEEAALLFEGEVVHVVPHEMAATGATPGVAVQFEATAAQLRERFEPLLGAKVAALSEGAEEAAGGRRAAKRGAVRVPIRVMPTSGPPFEATSRDLSASGILISMKGDVLPVGEIIQVCLWHPSGDPSIEIHGKVVRQVPNRKGRIAAVAVAFDRNQMADPRVNHVIDSLREAGHRSQLGGNSGSLADAGLANMLQMFGRSAPQGTLVVERDGEQGWVAFSDGQLMGAELGRLSNKEALIAMLSWADGKFQFEASIDSKLVEGASSSPLAGAVLDAIRTLDERHNERQASGLDADVDLAETLVAPIPILATTTFAIDFEREELSRSAMDKADDAILELAKVGMNVERLCEVIPETPETIQASIEGLVELGVLVPR